MEPFDWNPGTLLEMSGYYWKTCTLHAAVRLDLFSAIADDSLTAEQVSGALDVDPRGLATLLNALCAMELLTKKDNTYSNTDPVRTFLCKSSPQYIGFMIMHHFHLMESWHRMDEGIKKGGPIKDRSPFSNEEQRESFLMGMFNIGMTTAPHAATKVDLKGCNRLLDLGGGPGTFAIHFCLENPELDASIYDLATTRPFAEKTIARFNLSDRIQFLPGDYTEETTLTSETKFDAVWLSHILHGEGPDQAQQIVKKAVDALEPGGKIFIHEFILEDTMDGPLFPALFSLNMFLRTPEGQSYSQKQLTDMLEKCGVANIKRLDFVGPTQSGILSGTKSN